MWIKKLKKKKMQYAVIGLILACITAIFTGCLSFAFGIREFNDSYYSKDKLPEFYFVTKGEEGKEALEKFGEESNQFKELFLQKGKVFDDTMKINDKKISLIQMNLLSVRDVKDFPFDFHANGSIAKLKAPAKGTVWISDVYADLQDIKPGDELSFQGERKHTLKIAGTYNAAICPSASMAFYPFYINEADLLELEYLDSGYFGCFTRSDTEKPLNEFIEKLPKPFAESIQMQYDLDGLRLSLATTTLIVAGVGTGASFLIFLVSIIIIRFIIKGNLAKEYKSIGVYKALGFQTREIVGFYLKCYLLTGIISITIGAVLGLPIAKYLGTMSIRYLDEYRIGSRALVVAALAIAVLLVILLVNMYFALRKIKYLNPVSALNMEMASSKSKLKKSLIKNAHSPLSMAVNDIFKRKSTSIMIMLILAVAFYLSIFFMMINYTGYQLSVNTAAWFGVPNTGCFVNVALDDDIENQIEDSSYVEKVSFGQLYMLVSMEAVDQKADLTNCTVFSYSDFSEDLTGVVYPEGRAPKGKNELAFTTKALKNIHAEVGDYIKLKINDVVREYLIVGRYDSMMNGGQSVQMPNDVLDACNADYVNDIAFVELKDKADYGAFKDEIERAVDSADVTSKLEALGDSTKSVTEIIVPVTALMVVIFICFSFLNIVNLLMMNNIDNRKNFGILKALGFTNGYIMAQNVIKMMLLSLVSAIIALGIHFSVSKKLFQMMVSVNGLVDSIPVMAVLVGGMLLLIVLTSVMFTLPLRKITPTELMEE